MPRQAGAGAQDGRGTAPAPLHAPRDRKRVAGSRLLKVTRGSGEGADTSSAKHQTRQRYGDAPTPA